MSSIDERIVDMKFNNAQFQSGIKTTLNSLGELSKGLEMKNVGSGLDKVGQQVEGIGGRFSAMSAVALGALATIGSKAVTVGADVLKSFTLDPIMDGFSEYELKMGSIQTILANTSKDGTKLKDVSKALGELNEYSDQTIYNFGDMTSNIGKFTNAGIGLQDATDMIKGFSNEAAASGTSAEGAAGAAYQLSQALSAGVITLMDWKSLTNVGMGSANMKDNLIDIAQAMGKFNSSTTTAAEAQKNFNGSLEAKWMTADVMQNYLKIQAGEMNKEQIRALGLTEKQADALLKQQKVAQDAATKVRTATQLFGTLKESIGSSWATTAELVIGDFDQATDFFTKMSSVLGDMVGRYGDARNDMLEVWGKNGGREDVTNSVLNVLTAINRILKPIHDAWQEVFTSKEQGKNLAGITNAIEQFTKALIPAKDTVKDMKRTFAGVFAVVSIIGTTIKTVFSIIGAVFKPLAAALGFTGGSIFELTGSIGDFLVRLDEMFQKSSFVTKSAEQVGSSVSGIVTWIKNMTSAVREFGAGLWDRAFGGASDVLVEVRQAFWLFYGDAVRVLNAAQAKIEDTFDGPIDSMQAFGVEMARIGGIVRDAMQSFGGAAAKNGPSALAEGWDNLKKAGTGLMGVWNRVWGVIKGVWQWMTNVGQSIGEGIANIWKGITSTLSQKVDMDILASSLNLGLATAFGVIVMKIVNGLKELTLLGPIGDTLEAFQKQLKFDAIVKIAVALGILAASLWLVAQVPGDRLGSAAVAMALMGTLLVGMMYNLDKTIGTASYKKLPAITASMALLGGAMLLLAIAASKFAQMDSEGVAKALVGLSGALLASRLAGDNKANIFGLFILASAFKQLAEGVAALQDVDWGALAKAGVVMAALIGAMKLIDKLQLDGKALISAAIAMGLLGVSMTVLAGAILLYEKIDWVTFLDGLGKIAAVMLLLGYSFNAFPEKGVIQAAASLLILSFALTNLAGVILIYEKIGWETFAEGLGKVAAVVLLLGYAMNAFPAAGVIQSALAMVILAGALTMLTGVILALGNMPWQVLAIGIGAMVVALLALAGVTLLITPVIPMMLLLGAALTLISGAFFLAGGAIFLFSTGLAALVGIGALGVEVLRGAIAALTAAIPAMVKMIISGLIQLLQGIAQSADAIFVTIVGIVKSLLVSLRVLIPELVDFVVDMIEALVIRVLEYLTDNVPRFVDAAMSWIIALIQGIANRTPEFVNAVIDLIVNFINTVADRLDDIIAAGTNLIVAFIEGIGEASLRIVTAAGDTLVTFLEGIEAWIRDNAGRINAAGMGIADAIIDGMVNGITGGLSAVVGAAQSLADSAVSTVKGWLGIHSPSRVFKEIGQFVNKGFVQGLTGGSRKGVTEAFNYLRDELWKTMSDAKKSVKDYTEQIKDLKEEQAELEKDGKKGSKQYKENAAEIANLTKKLNEANTTYKKAKSARDYLLKNLDDERDKLKKLADEYTKVSKKLDDAKQKLADIKQERADYKAQIKDQYDNFADISEDTKLEDYFQQMRDQITKQNDLRRGLDQLRELGLNDKMYRQLLEQGTSALPFISQLLDGGKGAVSQINSLNKELNSSASGLAKDASSELYDAGVQAAAGLVEGLKKDKAKIQEQMDDIAESMANAIKKKLGIKSPSRVFARLGKFTMEGLGKGIRENAKPIEKATTKVGDGAVDALQKSLTRLSAKSGVDISLDPTIKPVLDLSQVKAEAGKLDSMVGDRSINVDTSVRRADAVSDDVRAVSEAFQALMEQEGAGKTVNYTQNNYSPKALSEAEIYRQTKNQLSKKKEELTT